MPLNPEARKFLDERIAAGSRPVNELTVEQARDQAIKMSALLGPGQSVAHVQESSIRIDDIEIPIRVYVPSGSGPFPVLVYFHGGGWVVGNLDTSDVQCRALTNAAGCLVISVNYRHAPEHKFPAAANDAYAATRYIASHAAEFNGDARRIAVGGSSAGGNLGAVVALMARDQDGPRLAFQLLMVPVIDHNFDSASYRENAEGYGLTREGMLYYWTHYLLDGKDGKNPYASPIRAEQLTGLPPALVITAEFDPLRDEGIAYAARLKEAGVKVTHIHRAGMIHGFLGAEINEMIAGEMRRVFRERGN